MRGRDKGGSTRYMNENYFIHHTNFNLISLIKGYLRYRMITSQIVSSEAQIENVFISQKNYVLFSRHSSFCIFNHSMIYRIFDVMMSIGT